MDLYQDDPTSLPSKAEGIRAISQALRVTIVSDNPLAQVLVVDEHGNDVPLYPDPPNE